MDTLNNHLRLADIAGKGDYEGKDYRDENGLWVLIYDAELWEKTGKKATTFPDFAHVEMSRDGWTPNQETLYRAREHWVTTTESFKVKTPIEEDEKINRRQEEIYWETVNEFFEWHKEDFFTRLANAPNGKCFWERELEDWRNYKFSLSVIRGERHFWQVIPKWMDDEHPTKSQDRGNNQAKEEGRCRFFKWLEELYLSKEVTPSSASISGVNKKEIYISPQNIEPIYNALAPYFQGQEAKLRQLLGGEAIEGKVRFNESAKVLCNTFNTLHEAGRIVATIDQIKVWICKYFQANRKPYDLTEGSSTLNRYFQEKIEMEGQILLPTIKGLIAFDKS